jgi:hypothetical protein
MTGGQADLSLDGQAEEVSGHELVVVPIQRDGLDLIVLPASAAEEDAHRAALARISAQTAEPTVWEALNDPPHTPEEG